MSPVTSLPTCIVCGAWDVPMTARTHGDAVLYLCDDPVWCQARAGANAVEAMGFAGVAPADEGRPDV